MRTFRLVAAATLATFLATTAMAAPPDQGVEAIASEPTRTGDIRSIVLFSGGVAEIVRSADVSGSAVVGMDVPLKQVNDVLKSLVVRNPGGGVGQVTLEGSVNAQELSRSALFQPADLNSLPQLLSKLKGARVRIEGDRSVTGTVLGTTRLPANSGKEDEPDPVATVSILTETGAVRSLPIFNDTSVEVLDEEAAAELRKAAGALARTLSDDSRLVSVKVEGDARRTVEFDYVVAAPVWKSSHRLVVGKDGKGRLQSWAVIENATGEDWTDVRVSLSSGSPVTLRQNLFDPFFKERPEVPVFVDRQSVPEPDRGAVPSPQMSARMAKREGSSIAGGLAMLDNMAPEPSVAAAEFEMSQASDVGEAIEGDVSVTYALPQPVTLAAGSTLSVPVVDSEVPAERIAVFKPGRGAIHPTAAVRLDNETGSALPAGIVTVYDSSGYVGDSTLLPVPPSEERLVQFALDRKIAVNTTERPQNFVRQMRIVDGVLRYKSVQERTTIYTAENTATEERKLSIEHPKIGGWDFSSPAEAAETENAYRLETVIPAGATSEIKATHRYVRDEGFALVDAPQSELIRFSKQTDDPEIARQLAALAEVQAELTDIGRRIDRLENEKSDIYAAQDRIRENIKAVGEGDLRDSYLETMRGQEDRLQKIDQNVAALRQERQAVESRLREMVRAI
ncbi:DUF4139 domain-containing protein [Jiella marina]|uniref:DUF4139 domain-containing protein n=1 Tax=Jiella sp. LLJ827 TaxID=2917712 RepID=UPI0021007819|nr:DUF4139 domain-containing protein [Jiella sp. LLJ827]MCQ0986689.1 hypothetical protein [Jiella sp. LLJ827]